MLIICINSSFCAHNWRSVDFSNFEFRTSVALLLLLLLSSLPSPLHAFVQCSNFERWHLQQHLYRYIHSHTTYARLSIRYKNEFCLYVVCCTPVCVYFFCYVFFVVVCVEKLFLLSLLNCLNNRNSIWKLFLDCIKSYRNIRVK